MKNKKRSVITDIKSTRRHGLRLKFVRINLNLKMMDVVKKTNIPYATYFALEQGTACSIPEYFILLSVFFDKLWKQEYKNKFPVYNKKGIKEITPQWLLFGI